MIRKLWLINSSISYSYFLRIMISYGWCGTVHHRPQQDPKSHKQHIDVKKNKGWGFCQRSCYPQTEVALGGIERFKVSYRETFCRDIILQVK